jgi:hypothetical protein
MKTRLGVIALLLTGLIANNSFAIDPSGTWRWEHQDPGTGRTIKNALALTSTNGEVGGSYVMDSVTYEVNNVKLGGTTLSWDYDLDIGSQVINISFSAEISDDTLAGTVNIPGLGDLPWAAQRDVAATVVPTGTWRWEHTDPATGQLVKDVLTVTSLKGEISGSYDMGGTTYAVNNSRVSGATLSWDFDLEIEGQTLNISFSGDISGDAIAGTVTIAGVGDFPWEAQRDVPSETKGANTSKWIITFTLPDGRLQNPVLVISDDQGTLSAVYTTDCIPIDAEDFTVEGERFSFSLSVPDAGITARFSGTVDNDNATGVIAYEVGEESGELKFIAKKSTE